MAEEVLVRLDHDAEEGAEICLQIRSHYGNTQIVMSVRGPRIDLFDSSFFEDATDAHFDIDGMSGATEEEIRGVLIRSFRDQMKFSYRGNENCVQITIARSRYRMLVLTMAGLVLGILCGILFRSILSAAACEWIDKNIMETITTVFMNSLKIIIAPVVFLSIITSVSGFGNMSQLGRLGVKTMGFYLMTSVLALAIGTGIFFLLQTGDPILATDLGDVTQIAEASRTTSTSLLSTLVGIVPDNLLKPFIESSLLQIIFLAIIIGLAMGFVGEKANPVKKIVDSLNDIFTKVTEMFIKLIPIATFCSLCSMVLSIGADSMVSVLKIVGGTVFAILLMIPVYSILLMIFGRMNPITVLKKYFPTMVQVFSLNSSNASVPLNMKACKDDLGVHPRVYSLTIPLGATINMDATCVALVFISLSFCNVFGMEITLSKLFTILIITLLLSLGMPGVPNAGVVALAMLVEQVAIPVEAVSLVMGIWPIIGMFSTANNCLGDIVGTLCVGKSEGLVNPK